MAHLAPADSITRWCTTSAVRSRSTGHSTTLLASRSVVVVNSWMWSFDDDPSMRRRARRWPPAGWAGGSIAGFNASQRLLMPSAYADRQQAHAGRPRASTARCSPIPDSRERVLFALAQGAPRVERVLRPALGSARPARLGAAAPGVGDARHGLSTLRPPQVAAEALQKVITSG